MKVLIGLILFMIVIGGAILLIPDPFCVRCDISIIKALGIAEVMAGISAVVVALRVQKNLR